jgi:hypothetical protein
VAGREPGTLVLDALYAPVLPPVPEYEPDAAAAPGSNGG